MLSLADLLAAHGLADLFPLAVAEGPVVVLTAAAFPDALGMPLIGIWMVAVLADLTGDVLLYSAGRFAPLAVPRSLQSDATERQLGRLFGVSGPKTLLLAKWTHVAGLPVLVAAGIARMPLVPFLWWNLIGTLPKAGCFVLAGWWLGHWAVQLWSTAGVNGVTTAFILIVVVLGFLMLKGRVAQWK